MSVAVNETTAKSKKCLVQSEPVQYRVYKSLKVWSMYADLEESFGTFLVCSASSF